MLHPSKVRIKGTRLAPGRVGQHDHNRRLDRAPTARRHHARMGWVQRQGWVRLAAGDQVWRLHVTLRYQPGGAARATPGIGVGAGDLRGAERTRRTPPVPDGHAVARQSFRAALLQQEATATELGIGLLVDVLA